jgi:hypothetical protein
MPAPEEKAAELLADVPSYLWDGRRLPVPVEEIVDSYLGLRICDAEDLSAIPGAPAGATLSGLLVVTDRKVYVNAGEAASSPGRRRFTIGHEAGHWCLHRDSRDTVFCRANGHGLDELPDDAPDIEDEASRFAGALLFPPALVRAVHARARGDVAKIAERFGASRVATERAIFRDVHRDAVRQRAGDEAVCFYWDDEGYDAWRAAHARDGFVANDNLDDPAAARLHRAGCSYLNRPAKEGQPRTRVPKWCSTEPGALRRALPEARVCTSCETAFRQSPPRKS